MDANRFQSFRDKVVSAVSGVIVGKEPEIELVTIAFICSGHVLLEDVPGTGKTMLLRAFSKAVGGSFGRVQFTPDLLPGDLTGITWFDPKASDFRFRPGPLFADIVLADEVNRATPRTQAALLEAMQERQITVDGRTYPLGDKFLVMATQNPLESYGTFPLPEAQVDRFLMCLTLGYPAREQELALLGRTDARNLIDAMTPVVTDEDVTYVRAHYRDTQVCNDVAGYLMDLIEATRREGFGVSTRGAISLYRAVQACAAVSGRDYAIPEDVRRMAGPVLAHRTAPGSGLNRAQALARLTDLLGALQVPVV